MKYLIIFLVSIVILLSIPKQNNIVQEYHIEKEKITPNSLKIDNSIARITFPKFNITRDIYEGTNEEVLAKGIGFLNLSYQIDDNYGNIVLGGHNQKNKFDILYQVNINDEVILDTYNNKFICTVKEKVMIDKEDFSYFELSAYEKILTLLTCSPDNKKRLVIRAVC